MNKKINLNKMAGYSSPGFGIGKAIMFNGSQLKVRKERIDDIDKEIAKFEDIIKQVSHNIEKLVATSDIFSAHLMIATDPVFKGQVKDHIIANEVSVAYAIKVISDFYLQSFDTIYDQHLQERRADILDVTNQMIAIALDEKLKTFKNIKEDSIVFADDLSPSQTADLDPTYIKGIVLFKGGVTSHTAILAKLHNIPLVINSDIGFDDFKDGALTILDAEQDMIFQDPDERLLKVYKEKIKDEEKSLTDLDKFKDKKTLTKDGQRVNLLINISNLDDLKTIKHHEIDGVGLFRTEFLYMANELPSEDYQYDIYKETLKAFPHKNVTIRTFDIGGDKKAGSIKTNMEENPFLGVRGIRLALKYEDILKTQLRALLRASVHGEVKIMFPMIASIEELIAAKKVLEVAKNELLANNIKIGKYKVGIMVEVPSVALNANLFAKHVDFFSIGSNDLIQYTFAADRLNTSLSYLYQPLNPGFLKLIEMTANAAKNHNIDISVCGEMAGYYKATPILIGLGINNLSMSISSILSTKELISKITCESAKDIAKRAVAASTNKQVDQIMEFYINSNK